MPTEERRKYAQEYYFRQKVKKLMNENLSQEEFQVLVNKVRLKHEAKKREQERRKTDEEIKRRYEFIYC